MVNTLGERGSGGGGGGIVRLTNNDDGDHARRAPAWPPWVECGGFPVLPLSLIFCVATVLLMMGGMCVRAPHCGLHLWSLLVFCALMCPLAVALRIGSSAAWPGCSKKTAPSSTTASDLQLPLRYTGSPVDYTSVPSAAYCADD